MVDWQESGPADGDKYTGIRFETAEGIAKITSNRPQVRNAFRPTTLFDLSHAFTMARDDQGTGEEAQEDRNAHVSRRAPDFSTSARRP